MGSEVVSAGFIVFRRSQDDVQYLMMKHTHAGHWTPPKGRVEAGETEMETAYRETLEEAGLSKESLKVLDGRQYTLRYRVRGRPKRVEYWVAELADPHTEIIMSHEHVRYEWLNFADVYPTARFEDMKKAYRNLDAFLKRH